LTEALPRLNTHGADLVSAKRPGAKVRLVVDRNGKKHEVDVMLGREPGTPG
jgi:S1-C subfamily serine protease